MMGESRNHREFAAAISAVPPPFYIKKTGDLELPFKEWSTGSYISIGVASASFLVGVGLLFYALKADPGLPFDEFGLVNRDLME